MGLDEESGAVALFRLLLLPSGPAAVSCVAFWQTKTSESPGEPVICCPPGRLAGHTRHVPLPSEGTSAPLGPPISLSSDCAGERTEKPEQHENDHH